MFSRVLHGVFTEILSGRAAQFAAPPMASKAQFRTLHCAFLTFSQVFTWLFLGRSPNHPRENPGANGDEDGHPVFRYTAPEHDPLYRWPTPVTGTWRDVLGQQQRILLAFNRAGACLRFRATA